MIPRGRSLRRLQQNGSWQAAFDEGFGEGLDAKNRRTFFEGAHSKVRIKKSTGKCQWRPVPGLDDYYWKYPYNLYRYSHPF